ncbi:MAG: transposase [Pyrinomonadaceae bacterium]
METIRNPREVRGIAIARKFEIKRENGFWFVPSANRRITYKVRLKPYFCSCPDFEFRRQKCKHIFAAQNRFEREFLDELTREEINQLPKPVETRPTYPQNWTAYNKSQMSEKAEFQRLLAELCKGIGEPVQENGRPRLPFTDMLFACAYKVFSTVSGRRFTTDLSEAKEKGYISALPHFNSVLRYFDNEMLTPHLEMMIQETSLPLTALEKDFAIDSSGLSTTHGFSWSFAKFEEPNLIARKNWLKVHICTGTLTNVVTAVRITDKYENDHNSFEPLVVDTRENFQMRTVSADKAYLSNHNMNVAAMNDAAPFIAFKSNSKPTKKENTIWNKMYHFYALHQELFLKEYHKRSNVESTFSMIKSKFSGSVRAKNKTSRTNEALAKILCHNICCLIQSMNEFGVSGEFWKEPTLH